MNCRRTRDRLMKDEALDGIVRSHLETCSRCAALAARLQHVTETLQEHPLVYPPAGFSSRVIAALEPRDSVFTWTTIRVLPATLVLAAALALWSWVATPSPGTLAAATDQALSAPSEDAISWILYSRSNE